MDIERWYNGMELFLKRVHAESNLFYVESKYLTQMFMEMFDGSPSDRPLAYREHSIVSASLVDGGNAKYLKDIPIRLYSEPDMDFYLNYGLD